VPMLPVIAGNRATRQQIFLYSLIMAAVAIAPWPLGATGALYGVGAAILSLIFVALAWPVLRSTAEDPADMRAEKRLFKYSVLYLFIMFGVLVADRMLLA
jgi:protoheme IX farnesyltransferase